MNAFSTDVQGYTSIGGNDSCTGEVEGTPQQQHVHSKRERERGKDSRGEGEEKGAAWLEMVPLVSKPTPPYQPSVRFAASMMSRFSFTPSPSSGKGSASSSGGVTPQKRHSGTLRAPPLLEAPYNYDSIPAAPAASPHCEWRRHGSPRHQVQTERSLRSAEAHVRAQKAGLRIESPEEEQEGQEGSKVQKQQGRVFPWESTRAPATVASHTAGPAAAGGAEPADSDKSTHSLQYSECSNSSCNATEIVSRATAAMLVLGLSRSATARREEGDSDEGGNSFSEYAYRWLNKE